MLFPQNPDTLVFLFSTSWKFSFPILKIPIVLFWLSRFKRKACALARLHRNQREYSEFPKSNFLNTQGEEFQHVRKEQKLHFIKKPPLYFCISKALYFWKPWQNNFLLIWNKISKWWQNILWKHFNTNYQFPISPFFPSPIALKWFEHHSLC